MLSFKSIAAFATLAFGAMSAFAAPLEVDANVDVGTLIARCNCKSVPSIIADVSVAVSAHVDALHYIKPENCTVQTLTPIVADIKAEISSAILDIQALIGQPAAVILAKVDGSAQVTVVELAQLVAGLLINIFVGLNVVIGVAGASVIDCVIPLLATVGEVCGAFIAAILTVTAHVCVGLNVALLACISTIISVIVRLHVNVLITLLGIHL